MPDRAERTNNMSKYLPKELIARFAELSDDFEKVIRADERKRIINLVNGDHAKTVRQPIATGVATGMHGEPLRFLAILSGVLWQFRLLLVI